MKSFKQHLEESFNRWDLTPIPSVELNSMVWYHGSNQPITSVDVAKGRFKSFSITTDKEMAEFYAKDRAEVLGGEPYLIEVKVNVSKPLFVPETNHYKYEIQEARKKKRDCVVGPGHAGPTPPLNMMIINNTTVVSLKAHKI